MTRKLEFDRMRPKHKLAFIGPKHSGKSASAEALIDSARSYQIISHKLAFADALRHEVASALASSNEFHTPEKWRVCYNYHLQRMVDPETKEIYRPLIKWWGTEYRRAEDPDYWIKAFERRFDALSAELVICDDCRFDNEYALLERLGFKFIRLAANPHMPADESDGHASEQDWKHFEFDYYLSWKEPVALRVHTLQGKFI